MTLFSRYIGIDYSGAKTPTGSVSGLRVYTCDDSHLPEEVQPPPGPRRHWTRRGLAEWLNDRFGETTPTLVGIDHAFSFPLKYFERHSMKRDWDSFLGDFCEHWPTDKEHMYVDFVRDGMYGKGQMRGGDAGWRRLTEVRAGGAKSVFHFDVPGSVAKSTHAGLPWLRYLRRERGNAVHFWPFDGWPLDNKTHVVAEVYPSLWRHLYPREDRIPDQQDAYVVCRWLAEADHTNNLVHFFSPQLSEDECSLGQFEGWILGVM